MRGGKSVPPQIFLVTFVFLLVLSIGTNATPQSGANQEPQKSAPAACPVTLPRKAPLTPFDQFFGYAMAQWHGKLYVGALWPDGTVVFKPGGSGIILPDGSLSMKFGWYRGAGLRGKLTIHGKTLDAPAPPLRAYIPAGDSEKGFQATLLIFPTEGCWETTGEVGDTSVTFVTRVVKVGNPGYEDVGACPFECCTYGQWTVETNATLLDRSNGTRVIATLSKGDVVFGLNGEVISTPVPVKADRDVPETAIKKGDIFYVLHYDGEGYWKVWLRGKFERVHQSVINVREPKSEWWVKVRDSHGNVGWSLSHGNFGHQDACE
jgi:hypothetical protein